MVGKALRPFVLDLVGHRFPNLFVSIRVPELWRGLLPAYLGTWIASLLHWVLTKWAAFSGVPVKWRLFWPMCQSSFQSLL